MYNMIDVTSQFSNYKNETNGTSRMNNVVYPPHSWQYLFTANMQEIIPGLFLGSYSSAQYHCHPNLIEKGVRYIICVRQDQEAHFIRPQINDPSFTYLTLDIADNVTENIIRFFPKVKEFIDEAHSKNFKVLVHGNSGNSRSATLVLAYIMEKFGLSSIEALQFVKERRASINPNEGFRAQLTEYEPIYKARLTLTNGEPSSINCNRKKRKSEQLSESDHTDYYCPIQPPPSPISDEEESATNCENNNNNNNDMRDMKYLSPADFSNHIYRLWLAKRTA